MLLFIAADRMEFAGLLRFCTGIERPTLGVDWARAASLHGERILMFANGAGAKAGAAAFLACPNPAGITAVINTGFCGALDPALGVGDIFVASAIRPAVPVRTPQTTHPHTTGVLASVDHVAQTAEEKRKLRTAGADAVEMEAAAVGAQAQALNLPFFCVRSVTDLAAENFANDLNSALRADGHFDTMQILRSAMARPISRLPELIRLRRRCAIAARALGEFLADCRF
jgi:nucleoside phosphorylase